jgi:tetratricopeptide (TPR) repeat protein
MVLIIVLPIQANANTVKTDLPNTYQQATILYEQQNFKSAQLLFQKLIDQKQQQANSLTYLSLINMFTNDLDKAEDQIEQALKLKPNSAFVQNSSGHTYGSIAQHASIFTALGYAKKSLNGFRNAVKLKPTNIDYQQALINFYLGAPSIAGGDTELAMLHAQAINKLDEKQGYIAIGRVLHANDDEKALAQHLTNTPESLKNDAAVLLSKGFIYQQQKKYSLALSNFQQAIENSIDLTTKTAINTKFQALYQLGKTSGIANQQLTVGIDALNLYIEQAPQAEQLASKEWAQFRLAKIIAKQGDNNKAQQMYQMLVKNTDDKRLKDRIEDLL